MLTLFTFLMQKRNIDRGKRVYPDLSDSGHSEVACVKDYFVAWWQGSAI